MADRSSLKEYANHLAETLRDSFGDGENISQYFVRDFVFETRHLPVDDYEDFGTLIFLECHEAHSRGEEISGDLLRRIAHRVRQRLVRGARRELICEPSKLAELGRNPRRTSSPPLSEITILRQIRELSVDETLVVELYAFDGKTPTEIAAILGVSVATVYRRLKSARDNLAENGN